MTLLLVSKILLLWTTFSIALGLMIGPVIAENAHSARARGRDT